MRQQMLRATDCLGICWKCVKPAACLQKLILVLWYFLPGVRELAEAGIIPGGTRRNFNYVKESVEFDSDLSETDHLMAADAQTSGGLLVALPENEVQNFISAMETEYFYTPVQVGNITEFEEPIIKLNR